MSIKTIAAWSTAALAFLPALAGAAVYNFESNKGTGGVTCTGSDNCSSAASAGFGGALGFLGSFGPLSTTGQFGNGSAWQAATVVQDDNGSNPKWVGLGVYSKINSGNYDNGDDNITSMEALVLTFANTVTLTDIKLRADGHGSAFAANTSFKYGAGPAGANPMTTTFFASGTTTSDNAKTFDIDDMTGTQFVFYGLPNLQDGTKQQYYLSEVTVVPEPEAYGLALAGMGVVAFAMRSRRRVH